MNKKLRYIAMTFVSIILVCCYMVRISYVNKDNAKAEVKYVSDSKSVQAGNLKIEVAEQKLYDVAEYVKEYPEIRDLYTYKGSYYEKFDGGNDVLRSYKKIFFIVLKVTNTGDKTEEIPYFEYKLYVDKNYAFDFYPTEVEYINKASGIGVKSQCSYKVKLVYQISDRVFDKDIYKNLQNMDNSIMVSGYPVMKNIKLSHTEYVKADDDAKLIYEDLVKNDNEEVSLPDTKENTILKQDEPYVKNGIKVYAESCEIYRKKFSGYKELGEDVDGGMFNKACIGKDDKIIWSDRYGNKKADFSIVIVNFTFVNDTKRDRTIYFYPFLHNYIGKRYNEYYFMSMDKKIKHKKNSSSYTVGAGSEVNVKSIFYLAENHNDKDKSYRYYIGDDSKKLYISLADADSENYNLEKGQAAGGIFMRVR